MKQKEAFLESEADAWFNRNRDSLGNVDPVTDAIVSAAIKPRHVLEVGCANGWRLAKLRTMFGCEVIGVEPSREAAMDAARLRIPVLQTTASCLPVTPGDYDMVIYGFCLYLLDPSDWLRSVAEGDAVLEPGGHLVIHDFAAIARPFARHYEHRAGILSYHFDFAGLWLASPLYHVVARHMVGDDEMVTVLKKSGAVTIPVRA